MTSNNLKDRLQEVQNRIDQALAQSLRNRSGLTMVAVTKRQPLSAVNEAFAQGLADFGESQIQEGVPKVRCFGSEANWHFIGHLQRNKVRECVKNFHFIHSVDSHKLLERIDNIAHEERLKPNIFLQVNLLDDLDKHGYSPDHLTDALGKACEMKHLNCIGIMGIPPLGLDEKEIGNYFDGMRDLREQMQGQFPDWEGKLSMGMSSDFEMAIKAGSHFIRVGTALFGARS